MGTLSRNKNCLKELCKKYCRKMSTTVLSESYWSKTEFMNRCTRGKLFYCSPYVPNFNPATEKMNDE